MRAIHCINPDCHRPYPQRWGDKFCSSCGASLQLVDRYTPLERLGSGGFAEIYTVWDEKTQTEKVLKVLVEDSPKAQELFVQEAKVLSSLQHPGIPKVDSDGYFYLEKWYPTSSRKIFCLVMEKIDGQTLEEVFEKFPQGCPEDLVLNWLTQAVDILQELHRRKILHRDIKPSNLMLRSSSTTGIINQGVQGNKQAEDQLVLIDFGGVKQFSSKLFGSKASSTKLYSSGYSPPEQLIGGGVGPATDFFALGRTMIEMLTGKSVLDLEHPITGKLLWRNEVDVNPQLADLLDDMTQPDMRSRPASAAIIQNSLEKMVQSSPQQGLFSQIQFLLQLALNRVKQVFANLTKAVCTTISFIIKAIFKVILACLDTVWTMFLTGLGGAFGATSGLILASQTNLSSQLAEFLSRQLPYLFLNPNSVSAPEILLFVGAGLGTAWGLVVAGGFGQKRRFLIASVMGIISYGFGGLVLQLLTPQDATSGVIGMVVGSVSLLTLSLGLRSHHIIHAVIAAFGTAMIFAGFPTQVLNFLNPGWNQPWIPVAFFGFMGILMSFWLGISCYLIVPWLRLFGWR